MPDYDPDWIPPPGATVQDLLSRKGTSNARAIVERLGRARATMLLEGQCAIDADIAEVLFQVLGLSVSFWLERERLYQAAVQHRQFERELLQGFPVAELKKRAYIQPNDSHAETMAEVLRFFGTEDAESCQAEIEQLPTLIKQKTSRTIVSRPGALAAWVRAGEIEAARMECTGWSRERLLATLPEFRRLTRTEDPQRYVPELKRLCRLCGVAVVVLRPFGGCSARGAVKFLSPTRAMLLLSYRHLSDDQFWFAFFHEIAHLLLHADDGTIIDDWDDSLTAKEQEADRFAADTLIPSDRQDEMLLLRDARSIVRFARSVGVSRGIVVGQMQYRGILGFVMFNRLKVYYHWNDNDEIEKRPK